MVSMKNILFKNGKTALLAGLDFLKIKEKSGIMIPKFICKDLCVELNNKFNVYFYDVDFFLNPDLKKIKKINLKNKNIKVFIFVHYFGYYFNIKQIKIFCQKKNIILIEDNSHGFGSKYKGKFIGTKSDLSFSSPHKTINSINSGGNLIIRNFNHNFFCKFQKENSFKKRLFNFFYFLKKINVIKKLKYFYESLDNNNLKNLMLIDDFNKQKLKKIDLKLIRNKKHEKYNYIKKKFSNLKKNFHYLNFDKGTIPWFFAIIHDLKDKNNINKIVKENNFTTAVWPSEFPVEVSNDIIIKKISNKITLIKI
jgi:dTDP-4-amino-4,6-dideoxygalactose transaminase